MIPKLELTEDVPCAKIAPYDLLNQLLLLDINEKERAINFIAGSMGLKTIPEAVNETGKSYNGIKNFGKTVRLIDKNYVILKK